MGIDNHLRLNKTINFKRITSQKRIAYYLWRYPVLSETFIQREIRALKQTGLQVEVIADMPDDLDILDKETRSLADNTTYLFPIKKTYLLKLLAQFLFTKPVKLMHCFFYITSVRYQLRQSPKEDVLILLKAIYLSGVLIDKRIAHVHCPWSDINAFILLVASKLTSIPYSLQARAHDVHRKISTYALQEKFGQAKFVITNSQFNKTHIHSKVNKQKCAEIHLIYEGLPPEQFHPAIPVENPLKEAHILSVGRLIEPKGLDYLLKACKILKDKGLNFRCKVIGGTEEPLYADYANTLKQLHMELGLEDRVFFAGAQPFTNVIKAYQKADMFVLPCVTAEDGTQDIVPNSIMEAMAMMLPVISTNQTAIPEMIENSVSGILISPKDEHALAEAMICLINDEELRKKLGENARKRIEERFDIRKNIIQYVELFTGTS